MFLTCHLLSQTFAYKLGAKGLGEGGGKSLSLWLLGSIQAKRKTTAVKVHMYSWDIVARRTQAMESCCGPRPPPPPPPTLCHLKSFHLPQS